MDKIQGKVLAVTKLTDRITAFEVGRTDHGVMPVYTAGSHVLFDVSGDDTRAYSLIDFTPPDREPVSYRIAVQREPEGQGGSTFMHALKQGDNIGFSAPKNDFPLDVSAPAVLLAGGIGVTPMISMATQLAAAGQGFVFHYAGRSRNVMAYTDELAALCGDALHLHFDDDPATALDLSAIMANLGDAHVYFCGPRGMIDAARAAAEAANIPAEHVHIELFETVAPQTDDDDFEVEVASTGAVFTVNAGQSIIEALEGGGVDVMYDCQRGDCGICQCDVISGTPDHRDVVLSEDERASGKVMQICVSRSKSPRLVLDL